MRNIIEHFLQPKELDAFGLWAFGDNFQELDHPLKFMEAWNEIHGDNLMLQLDGIVQYDIPYMIEMWKNEKN